MLRRAPATVFICAVMTLYFFFVSLEGVGAGDRLGTLIRFGAITPSLLRQHDYWRLVAALFIHGGLFHLGANIWALAQLGYAFERMFGTLLFTCSFFLTGIVASLASAAFLSVPASVGASGAIFGVLASFLVLLLNENWDQRWIRNLAIYLGIWGALSIIVGITSPEIDNAAHLGGAIAGAVVGLVMRIVHREYLLARTTPRAERGQSSTGSNRH